MLRTQLEVQGGAGILPVKRTGWKACATESEFLIFSTRNSL
jgi:hypothetical protein